VQAALHTTVKNGRGPKIATNAGPLIPYGIIWATAARSMVAEFLGFDPRAGRFCNFR
jgi:hypothetical protein